MERTFKILMEILNKTIKILNMNGYQIRNPIAEEFYITEIYFDKETSELYFKTVKEK